ncbi:MULTISPECIES: ABC transporter ATP-binding protein [Halorussus]|uniref:ABC transporter ATP-binding protein n=1 Tax=Halorussus TaxID=1070314 RepID=UPI000E2128D1|nr:MULTISPECIES: ABC transporter ATP-binding protein [Halorussus]NHN59390.1 ABC transporter ATP-binding protein [Halorussus sp. JP-T4]
MTAIETTNLTKRYGDVLAVDSLDLCVEEGEVYGFLGPNGAGKSTTINLLLNFLHPTTGTASVLGYDTQTDAHELRKHIGILPENATGYERLTGHEHLEFANACKDSRTDIDAVLDRVGLRQSDADRAVGEYSKGMAQRLGLGMALVGDPDLLILDEPSSGLDPSGMRKIRAVIREEAAAGTTVFFSSHILPEVEAVCDRVGILREGDLVVEDSIENLRESVFTHATIDVVLRSEPQSLTLESVPGVEYVDVDGRNLHVVCANRGVKADVVMHLQEHEGVADILSEPASLEEMFEAYTNTDECDNDGQVQMERNA